MVTNQPVVLRRAWFGERMFHRGRRRLLYRIAWAHARSNMMVVFAEREVHVSFGLSRERLEDRKSSRFLFHEGKWFRMDNGERLGHLDHEILNDFRDWYLAAKDWGVDL